MKLDAELIDIASDLRPLRFVLFQLILQIGNLGRDFRWRLGRGRGDYRGLAAILAGQRHPRRRGVDDKRGRAMRAGEDDIFARRRD